jgi:hypothetical protein
MNERIRELISQCTETLTGWDDHRGNYTEKYFDKEKFAELIVRECVSIVAKRKDQAIDDGWNIDEAMSMAEMDFLEHFGVEE